MNFKEYALLCKKDVSRFQSMFATMLDLHGPFPKETIGFHFSLDEEDLEESMAMLDMVSPVVIWAGTAELVLKLSKLGRSSVHFPYFEDGGFAVVLCVPAKQTS